MANPNPNYPPYGGSQGGYGAPQSGAPPGGYGAQQPGAAPGGYGAQQPGGAPGGYGAPSGGYGAAQPGAPPGGYGAAQPGAPPGGYGAAQPGAPPGGYGAAQPGKPGGYGAPGAQPGGYGAPPSSGYGAPQPGAQPGGYGAPPSGGYGAPQPGAPPAGSGYPGAPSYGAQGGWGGSGGAPSGAPPGIDAQVHQWFLSVDSDRSGRINMFELQQALTNANWSHFNPETCRLMIGLFDRDQSGQIELPEFQALWNYITQWKSVFEQFDRDRSGSIDANELNTAFNQMGYRVSPQFSQMVIFRYDPLAKKRLTLDNFIQACVLLKTVTDTFRQKDSQMKGQIQLSYEDFLTMVLLNKP